MTAVRALPIRVAPLPGEALDSWLEFLSHRLRATYGDVLAAVGLNRPAADVTDQSVVMTLPAAAAEQIGAATAQPASRITAMTLANYPAQARVLSLRGRFARTRARYSRFCPHCLADNDGRWQLRWRLGYSFACPIHHCLLRDTCPSCGNPQRNRMFPGELTPHPGHCGQRATDAVGRLARRCGADLRAAPTIRFDGEHPALRAQSVIDTTIDSGAAKSAVYGDRPVPAADFLTDLKAVGARALSVTAAPYLPVLIPADLQDAYRSAASPPAAAAPGPVICTAVALTAAATILDHPDRDAAAALLARLETPTQRNGASLDWPLSGWARHGGAAVTSLRLTARAAQLTPTAQLRYRIGAAQPAMPALRCADSEALASRLPATLWGAWAVRLRPAELDHARFAAALPAMLLLVNSRISAAHAHQVFGSGANWRTTTHQLRALARDRHWPHTREALIRLADYLLATQIPIDYDCRRRLDYTALLPGPTWEQICTESGTHCGGPSRLRLARCHLYTIISANPADLAPGFRDTNHFRSALFRFPTTLTPALLAALQQCAATFLRDNNVDEPTTWCPPLNLMNDLTLPGVNPDQLPLDALHTMVRQRQPITTIAARLHTTPDAIRQLLCTSPAPPRPRKRGTRTALSDLAADLPGDTLRDLYETQGMSLQEVAQRFGTSRTTVARLTRRYGITVRPAQRRRVQPDIDRNWLHHQYVDQRRTLPDLAAEKGMSTANMARWAHHHRIPLRGRGGPSHTTTLTAIGAAKSAPKLLQPALTGIGGAERLTRFAAASTYPSVTTAAAALGLHQAVLQHQINRLADDLGGALLTRAQRNQPMTTTPLGTRVLRAWSSWVNRGSRHLGGVGGR